MAKLHEPWQWMMALTVSCPDSRTTVRMAAGWSRTAAWSSVHSLGSTSMLARQFSSHTSYPSATSASTSVCRTGARKMLLRTPAPCTKTTGPLFGFASPRMRIRCNARPSPARKGMTSSE